MGKGRRVIPIEVEGDVIRAFEIDLVPMIELAKRYGVKRQGIYKLLKRNGVDTSKRSYPVKCHYCEKVFYRTKSLIRKYKHHFCNQDCYYAFLEMGGIYKPWRHGSRIAREKVGRLFKLLPGYIVHHEDKNQFNNDMKNLKVFACNGDHIRYHRCGDVEPLWDGGLL